jgi:hypothetical protein
MTTTGLTYAYLRFTNSFCDWGFLPQSLFCTMTAAGIPSHKQ